MSEETSCGQNLMVEDLTRVLDFSTRGISVLPVNVLAFTNIEEMLLNENEFTEIPEALFEFQHLKACNLSRNLIVKFGKMDKLEKWAKLERLYLSFNSIFMIPEYISSMSALKTLDIEHNGIKELPSQLCTLKQLRSLNISFNLITKLPDKFHKLKNLKYFIADDNQITSLPAYPEKLNTRLQRVSLRNNPIKLPDNTITRFRDDGISVQFGSVTPTTSLKKRTSVPSIETNPKPKSIRRSASSGADTKDDNIVQLTPGSTYSSAFIGKIPKGFASLREKKSVAVRSRSKSDANNPNQAFAKRRSPRTSLKRSTVTSIAIQTVSSESTPMGEIEVLPREIKNSSPINYVVENEAASVAAATKEQLIALLTYDSGIDMLKYQKFFCCTYPTFMTSQEFLSAIEHRFDTAKSQVGKKRVIALIVLWVYIQLIHIVNDNNLKSAVLAFVNKHCDNDDYSEHLLTITSRLNDGVIPKPDVIHGNHWALLKPKEIARCLCTINQGLLKRIELPELVDGRYNQLESEENSTALNKFANWFNIECNWAATSVGLAGSVLECSYLIQTFIQIIDKCLGFRNFSSAMAIYSALNMGAVQRLSTAWANVPTKYSKMLTEFDRVFSFKMNFSVYRDLLRNTEPPCIPIFSVVARDLTHIEGASPKEIVEGNVTKINFERLSGLATHLIFIRNCQLISYDNDEKSAYMLEKQIRDIKQYEKQELYLLCEDRETSHAAAQASKKKNRSSLKDVRDTIADWKSVSVPNSPQTSPGSSMESALKKSKKRKSSRLSGTYSPASSSNLGRSRPTSMIMREKTKSSTAANVLGMFKRSSSIEDLKNDV